MLIIGTLIVLSIATSGGDDPTTELAGTSDESADEEPPPEEEAPEDEAPEDEAEAPEDEAADAGAETALPESYVVRPALKGDQKEACQQFSEFRTAFGNSDALTANDAIFRAATTAAGSSLEADMSRMQSLFVDHISKTGEIDHGVLSEQYRRTRDEISDKCFKPGSW